MKLQCRVSRENGYRSPVYHSPFVSRTREFVGQISRSVRTQDGVAISGVESEAATMCDTRNLARAFLFVYEAIKSRQLGLRRFSFVARRARPIALLVVGFTTVLYLGAT